MATPSTKRRKRTRSKPNLKAKVTGILILVAATLYLYFLWRTQSFLDTLEEGGRFSIPSLLFRKHAATKPETTSNGGIITSQTGDERIASELAPHETSTEHKFMIFIPITSGQGTGNIIAGLLAAHLLALEFSRIVCVSPIHKTFLDAFEPANPVAIEMCPKLLAAEDLPAKTYGNSVRLVNFESVPDECELQDTLASDIPVIYMESNTYPRWPAIPDNFFFTYYRAKPALLELLPYQEAPTTVVHLREPDGAGDARKGLDNDSLKALGEMLPRDTYLVTNRVEWYDKFEQEYGWSHPEWNEVKHSAFQQRSWGVRGTEKSGASSMVQPVDKETQTLQMWCDWYTILTAKFVYHTHSDFSISAIHWQNLDSRTIMGWNDATGKLELEKESWRQTGETERLVDRTVDGEGTSNLRECNARRHKAEQEIGRQREQ
jgi:hypothetical protein